MDTQPKPRVHLGCEVHLISGIHDAVLVPGQAFPISLYQGKLADQVSVPGRVEIRIFASLWQGDKLYTDLGSDPMSAQYIKDHGLASTICAHGTKNGFGITRLSTVHQLPGAFRQAARLHAEYPVDEVLDRETRSMSVAGQELYLYMVPGIYAKLSEGAPRKKRDVDLWDAGDGRVHVFRRLPVPVVLGAFDTFPHHASWQKELWKDAMLPWEIPLLRIMLDRAVDRESKYYDIFETDCYYYALFSRRQDPTPGLMAAKDYRGYLADIPYVRRDVWAPIDFGRRHVLTWKNTFRYLYSA